MTKLFRRIMPGAALILFLIIELMVKFNLSSHPLGVVAIRTLLAVVFICVGYIMPAILKPIAIKVRNDKVIYPILTIVLLLIEGVITFSLDNNPSFFIAKFDNIFITLVQGVMGSLAVAIICKWMELININRFINMISFCGSNSLAIMLIHPTVLLVFTYLFNDRVFVRLDGILAIATSLFLYVVVLLITCIVTVLVNRLCPWILGKKSKVIS